MLKVDGFIVRRLVWVYKRYRTCGARSWVWLIIAVCFGVRGGPFSYMNQGKAGNRTAKSLFEHICVF